MKFGIILNYENYQQTIVCSNSLLKAGMDKVIIVDNVSKNNSFYKLEEYAARIMNVSVILNKENNGYARGNNFGLEYIENTFGLSEENVVYIINPDSFVSREIVDAIRNFIINTPKSGAVTTLINNTMKSTWHHMTPRRAFIFNSWCIRWLLMKFGIREEISYDLTDKIFQPVDVVMGAFFGIKQVTFKSVGYFDEGTFLYYEEEALYAKLKQRGVQNYILNTMSFEHLGRGSTALNKIAFKRINDNSRNYVLKKYYKVGKIYLSFSRMVNHIDNTLLILLNRKKIKR